MRIKKCRACGSTKLQEIINLGELYLSDFPYRSVQKKPEKGSLDLILCGECSLLQLRETMDPNKLYGQNYGYYSGINSTIKADLEDIVKKALQKVMALPDDIVLDIGSNDGTLLKNYPQEFLRIGVDPIKKFKKYYNEPNLELLNDFFSLEVFRKRFPDRKAKIITAISCFYDLDNPNEFLKAIVEILDEEGIFIIQQNYLASMLVQNAFDNIVHEHLEYYSLTSLTKLLNRYQLDIVDVEVSDINGGSFRTYIKHMDNLKKMRLGETKLKLDNRWTYYLFVMRINQIRKKLYQFVKSVTDTGKIVYVYGASTRGNTLLQFCGLDHTLIKAAIERNPTKWGRKIASVGIPIISEEQARAQKPDYMLILPWFFLNEFIQREKDYLLNGGSFIVPLPEIQVVDASNYSRYTIG